MGSDEEKMKTGAMACGAQQPTLLEEMKLLKEMQDHSVTRKAISSELWHACAGPLVNLPPVGSLVYYYPQGHSEQVAVSTKTTATSQIPNYPNLASQLLCQVHNVTLHADKDTDEIFAQMSLQPVNSEKDVFQLPDFGLKPSKHPSEYFCKTLTASDTSTHGGFSVPRRAAEKLFPTLDFTMQPPSQELVVRDLHENTWTFRHIYRGQPKRHLLTTGWSLFVGTKRLRAGDSVLFIRDERSQLMVGVRRANRQQTTMPSSVLSADSMHIGVLAAAAHAAANRSPFTIFYNPRACPCEFVIPLAKYRKSVFGTQVSVGMRFGMMFETEESGKRRYMGTIVGISDLDPLRWPGSKWRNLQVEWDEAGCTDKPNRVSSWEIETPESLFIFPSLTGGLKRPFHPGYMGIDSEWASLVKRPFYRIPEIGNGDLLYSSISNLCSEQLVKMVMKPQMVNMTNTLQISPVPMQEMKIAEGYNNQLLCSENQNLSQHSPDQPQENTPGKQTLHVKPVNQTPATTDIEKAKVEPEGSTDQTTSTDCSAEKPTTNPMNPSYQSASLHHNPGLLQVQSSAWSVQVQPQFESSDMVPKQIDMPQSDPATTNGLLPYVDGDEWMMYPPCQSLRAAGASPMLGSHSMNLPLPPMGQEMWDHPLNNFRCLTQVDHQAVPFSQPDPYSLNCLSNSTGLRDLSDESNNQSGVYSCLNVDPSSGGSSAIDPCASISILDEYCGLKSGHFQNPSDSLLGNMSSSQDLQSQITCASLTESQGFSRQDYPDNSGGTSSSNMELDESSLLQNSSWQQVAPPPVRTYTKVQKAGSVGRSIDVTSFKKYEELCSAIECMFGLEGLLNDSRGSGWKLVYVDYENDVLLVGDDPWEEFVGCVRCIRILSPSEVKQMSEEGMKLLNSAAMQGMNSGGQA